MTRRVKLTQAKVAGFEPEAMEYTVADTGQPGLHLRVRPSGAKSFTVRYRTPAGRKQRFTIGPCSTTTVGEARARAAEVLAEARRGRDPQGAKVAVRREPTIRELLAAWDMQIGPSKSPATRRKNVHLDRKILAALGDMPASTVRRADVAQLHRDVSRTAKITANRCVERLRAALNACRDDLGMLPETYLNPAAKVGRNAEEPRRVTITPEQWQTIEAACIEAPDLPRPELGSMTRSKADAIRFLLYRGLRRGEACALRWEHVSLSDRVITLPGSKTGTLAVAIDDTTMGLLAGRFEQRDPATPWVFPSNAGKAILGNALSDAFARLCRRHGIEGITLHDLRRSWVTTAVSEGGVPLVAAGRAVGHRSSATTARYFRPSDAQSLAVANAVAGLRKPKGQG